MSYINPNEYGSLYFDNKEANAVLNVLKNEKIFRYASDKVSTTDKFEEMLKKKVNCKYALGVTNGTSGLITALIGCDVKAGDRVLVSSYTFLATALAVKCLEAIPIPLNIDLQNGFDLQDLEEELKKGCKAVIVVQLQGRCFDLSKVKCLLEKYNVKLIEDSCQAFGAKIKDEYAGTIGDVGVYSFQQFKQVSCGEGGAVVTNNKTIYQKMRNYTDMGAERNLFPNWNGNDVLFGQNYRMNNIMAAILCEQLKKADDIILKQQKSRNYILSKVKLNNLINSVDPNGDTGMNILLLLNSKEEFNNVKEIGDKQNIEVRRMWNGLYFENELFKRNKLTDVDLKNNSCSKSKELVDRLAVISIPPILKKEDCNKIIDFLNEIKSGSDNNAI